MQSEVFVGVTSSPVANIDGQMELLKLGVNNEIVHPYIARSKFRVVVVVPVVDPNVSRVDLCGVRMPRFVRNRNIVRPQPKRKQAIVAYCKPKLLEPTGEFRVWLCSRNRYQRFNGESGLERFQRCHANRCGANRKQKRSKSKSTELQVSVSVGERLRSPGRGENHCFQKPRGPRLRVQRIVMRPA